MEKYLDRITEAYNGDMGEWMMKKSRERIDWICSKATGNKILDVGCSQGIVPILLGRGGFEVTGIDISAEAIQYANESLIHENFSTQKNIRFFYGDFLQLPFEANAYDTIILTEFLEHVDHPEAFVDKSSICLKDNGRVIVTVPFGINDWPDHKRTYYLADLYELLSRYFSITDIEFFGKWIGFVADSTVAEGQNTLALDLALLRREEKEFFAIERELIDSIKAKTDRHQKLEATVTQQNAKNAELIQKHHRLLEDKDALMQEHDRVSKEINELEVLYKQQSNRNTELLEVSDRVSKEKDALMQEHDRVSKEKDDIEKRLSITESQRDTLYAERDKLTRQISKQTAEYRKLQAENNLCHQKYDLLANSKLGKLTQWYWSEKSAFRGRNGRARERLKEVAKNIPVVRLLVLKIRDTRSISSRQSKIKADEEYFSRIAPMLLDIPKSNGGRYYEKLDMRIGIVCDQFYYDSIYGTADFVYLSPENWEGKMDGLSCLLLVSTWKGLHNEEWRGTITEGSPQRNLLNRIIIKCREKGIPTIFYSKEDPPNYAHFIGIAQKCDYIFTSAEECISDYVHDCGHDRVYALCFGINPFFHNPIGLRHVKYDDVIFSGSWMEKYPERCSDLQTILDGVLGTGRELKIIDRNYYIDNRSFRFPDKYIPYISPAISHDELQKVHKLYNWAININSVKKSKSMFAARAYELQAAGSLMLSNYSVGLNNLLPLIHIVQNGDEIERILSAYTPEEIYERQISGVRFAMTGETCYDRFAEILIRAGFPTKVQERNVAVIAKEITPRIRELFDRQSLNKKSLLSESEVTDEIIEHFDIVAFFDENMDYLEFYLEDMCNGFKYTNSDYITKNAYLKGGKLLDGIEHDYVKMMGSKYCTVFWRSAYTADQLLGFGNDVELQNGYSIDHFNYDAAPACMISSYREYKLSVIIPILNNGKRLYGKAFASLRRSSVLEDMQIILVDRGSSDGLTNKIVSYISRQYPNIRSILNETNSDPISIREAIAKGLTLADGNWIVFLNPENEAVGDAYAELIETADKKGLELVIGNTIEDDVMVNLHKNSDLFDGELSSDADKAKLLGAFPHSPIDLQSALISKELINRLTGVDLRNIMPELISESRASMMIPAVIVNIYNIIG